MGGNVYSSPSEARKLNDLLGLGLPFSLWIWTARNLDPLHGLGLHRYLEYPQKFRPSIPIFSNSPEV